MKKTTDLNIEGNQVVSYVSYGYHVDAYNYHYQQPLTT